MSKVDAEGLQLSSGPEVLLLSEQSNAGLPEQSFAAMLFAVLARTTLQGLLLATFAWAGYTLVNLFQGTEISWLAKLALMFLAVGLVVRVVLAFYLVTTVQEVRQNPLLLCLAFCLTLLDVEALKLPCLYSLSRAVEISEPDKHYKAKCWISTVAVVPNLLELTGQLLLQGVMAYSLYDLNVPWPRVLQLAMAIAGLGLLLRLGALAEVCVDPVGHQGNPELRGKENVPLRNFLAVGSLHHIGLLSGMVASVMRVDLLTRLEDFQHLWLLLGSGAALFALHTASHCWMLHKEAQRFGHIGAQELLYIIPRASLILPLSFLNPLSVLLFNGTGELPWDALLLCFAPSLCFHVVWFGWIVYWLWCSYFEVSDGKLELNGVFHAFVIVSAILGVAKAAFRELPELEAHGSTEKLPPPPEAMTESRLSPVPFSCTLTAAARCKEDEASRCEVTGPACQAAGTCLSLLALLVVGLTSYVAALRAMPPTVADLVMLDSNNGMINDLSTLVGFYKLLHYKELHPVYRMAGQDCIPGHCPTLYFRHHRNVEAQNNRWVVSFEGLALGNSQSCDPSSATFEERQCALFAEVNDTKSDPETVTPTTELTWQFFDSDSDPQDARLKVTLNPTWPSTFTWKDTFTPHAGEWTGTYHLVTDWRPWRPLPRPQFLAGRPVYRSYDRYAYFRGGSWWIGTSSPEASAMTSEVKGILLRGGSGALPFVKFKEQSSDVEVKDWRLCQKTEFKLEEADLVCSEPAKKEQEKDVGLGASR